MSVVPMKLLTIAGPLDRFDDVVRTCVIDQEFHPENALQLMRGVGGLRPLELENPYAALLRRSIEVADEAGIPLDYAPFDPTASLEEMAGYFDSLADQASALHRKQEELEHQMDEARSMVDQLQNLRGLDVKLDELWGLDHARFRYGYLPRETYDGFRDALDAEEDLFFVPTTVGRRRVYGVYFTTKESHHKVDSLMNSLHFTRIHLEEPPRGTVDAATAELNARTADIRKAVEAVAEQKLLSMLPEDLRPDFADVLTICDPEIHALVKAADKLSAYLKCVEERKAGNVEFRSAEEQTYAALRENPLPALDYFMERFLPGFQLTLDELQKSGEELSGQTKMDLTSGKDGMTP